MTQISPFSLKQFFASLITCLMLLCCVSTTAHAGLLSAQTATNEMNAATPLATKEKLQNLLKREHVVNALAAHGVSVADARQRLAGLTDDEVIQLQTDIDSAPAGAGIVGGAIFVFVVLLGTDIFGVTKVFPFTRPIR